MAMIEMLIETVCRLKSLRERELFMCETAGALCLVRVVHMTRLVSSFKSMARALSFLHVEAAFHPVDDERTYSKLLALFVVYKSHASNSCDT